MTIKVKGRKVFADGKHIATITGARVWQRGEPRGEYGISFEDGRQDEKGWAYFGDVVRALPSLLEEPRQ